MRLFSRSRFCVVSTALACSFSSEKKNRPFTGDEQAVTQTIASQLVNIVENARLLSSTAEPARAPGPRAAAAPLSGIIRGKPASEGLTSGPVLVRRRHQDLDDYLRSLPPAILGVADFAASLVLTEKTARTDSGRGRRAAFRRCLIDFQCPPDDAQGSGADSPHGRGHGRWGFTGSGDCGSGGLLYRPFSEG